MMKKWTLVVPAIALLGVGTMIFLWNSNEAGANLAPGSSDKAQVIIQEAKSTDDMRRLLVPVKVEAKVSSTVTSEIEGLVTRIKKPLGSQVKVGDIILYVENKDPSFTFAAVPVRSPVAGVISQIQATLMSKVSRGDRLFSVMDPKSLKLSAEIPGNDLSLVQPGMEARYKADLSEKEGTPVKVIGISPLVDPRTGTASAELEFVTKSKKKDQTLPPIGSVGHVLFEINRGKVILVPENAIGYSQGKSVVRVVDKAGKVERKPVELGEQKESLLVVKSGLEEGTKFVVRSSRSLKDGEVVEVEAEPARN